MGSDLEQQFNFSMSDYFTNLASSIKPYFQFDADTAERWQVWRSALKTKLMALMGPMPFRCELEPSLVAETDCGDYVREKVVYKAEDRAPIPAYVLIPKERRADGKLPAVLCLHGHNGGRDYGKDGPSGITRNDPKYEEVIEKANYDYAVQFCRRGYLTLAPDARGFGERYEHKPRYERRDSCNVNFLRASLLGYNLLALNLLDHIAALDYLCQREDVDPERIGAAGLSMGGTHAMYIAALDERIKVACISGYLTSFVKYAIEKESICGSQYLPNLYRFADVPDICGLIAPRPLIFENGREDATFDIETAQAAFARVKEVYDVAGVADRVDIDIFDGGHQFSGRKSLDWFDRWLKEA